MKLIYMSCNLTDSTILYIRMKNLVECYSSLVRSGPLWSVGQLSFFFAHVILFYFEKSLYIVLLVPMIRRMRTTCFAFVLNPQSKINFSIFWSWILNNNEHILLKEYIFGRENCGSSALTEWSHHNLLNACTTHNNYNDTISPWSASEIFDIDRMQYLDSKNQLKNFLEIFDWVLLLLH